jgi:hypothetical protein
VIACMFSSSESWDFNSTHVYGTHVPVEEPSTASKADSCSAAKRSLFDHFIGAGEQRRRNFEAKCFRGLEVNHQLVLS